LQNITNEGKLISNYPNPFTTQTTFTIDLQTDSYVTLKIVDVQGKLIKILLNNKNITSGKSVVTWDAKNRYGNNVTPGLYFGVMKTDSETEIIKLIIQ